MELLYCRRQAHTATYCTNNQRTQISGTQSSNSIWAPWGWSNEWTESCRGNVTKRFL